MKGNFRHFFDENRGHKNDRFQAFDFGQTAQKQRYKE
jgi:hypothetical protein